MLEPLKYFVVDAFADRPFSGNPAAVVPLNAWPDNAWLKNVAMEMNLSETAFFVPAADGFALRWFTPAVEVDLCGHATLATARVLAELGLLLEGATADFSTRSGLLRAARHGERFELDFPVKGEQPAEPPDGLLEALGTGATYVGRNQFDYLVEVESAAGVRALRPDFGQLAQVACRGIIVTARGDDRRFDFVSRFFAPAAGVNEDPVTGSAHCCLSDYWGRRLGKTQLVGYQASQRGGVVHVERRGDRVLLGGRAILMARGELLVDPSQE